MTGRSALLIIILFSMSLLRGMKEVCGGTQIEKTSLPSSTNKFLRQKLIQAVKDKKSDEVALYLIAGANPTVIIGEKGRSLLHIAIEYSSYKEALALVSAGANQYTVHPLAATIVYDYPYTPLLCLLNKINDMGPYRDGQCAATSPAVPPLIHALIDKGAALNVRTCLSENCLHLLANLSDTKEKINIARIILNRVPVCLHDITSPLKRTPLFNAVLSNDVKYVEFLIQQGAAVNAKDACGRNSLHVYVSEYKNPGMEIPSLLVKNLLDPHAKDAEGRGAVWYATYYGRAADFIAWLKKLCNSEPDTSV